MSESVLKLLRDARRVRKAGRTAIAERQRERLAEMVVHARTHSLYYRELYEKMPERVEDATLLPITNKKQLMARFDDWVTDREVTIVKVRKFIEDPARIGEKFLGKYVVATTSGTTGTPGIFVLDDRHRKMGMSALRQAFGKWLTFGDFMKLFGRGMRIAALHATGRHFVSVTTVTGMRRSSRLAARIIQNFSVHTPIPKSVAELNSFRPALIAGYATVVSMLAAEQEARRLRINPVLLVVTAEGLPEKEYGRIAKAFGAKVGNVWGSTEFGGAAYSCDEGWLHVIEDWAMIEPVDANFQPTPPGEQSHTVLVSNLVNRVQPIFRYDLGDSILVRPDPCPCGNPLRAIRVQGRSSDVLTFSRQNGERISIPPLAFEIDVPGLELIQVVQRTPTNLRVRVKLAAGADMNAVWQSVQKELTGLLAEHNLSHVTVERAEEPPEQTTGGKYRTVIPAEELKQQERTEAS